MNKSATKTPGSEQESARLGLGELFELADDLGHRSRRLRGDGRRILNGILGDLQTLGNSPEASTNSSLETNRIAFSAVRRELQSNWLRVDSLIDDLLSSAADELSSFANTAESRIAAFERAIQHRKVADSMQGELNSGQ